VKEPRFKRAGRGIVNRVPAWRPLIRDVDLIVCDMVGFGEYKTIFDQIKKPTISCSEVGDLLELDRRYGMKVAKTLGITIPETWEFRSVADARNFPKALEWRAGFVVKPDGNLATSTTMVIKDSDLWDYSLDKLPPATSLIIQRIVDGVEISTEGWFNGETFITPFNHTFEEKRFLVGNLGQNTGCMGNIVFRADSNKLTRNTVERLEPLLKKIHYHGPIDINCIVNEKGAFALEFTARLGYDAIETLYEGLHGETFADFLFGVAMGRKEIMRLSSDTLIAVRLSIPPWPISKPAPDDWGEPVGGITPANLPHLYFTDLYRDRDGKYKTAGGDGVLLKATARGRAVENTINGKPVLDFTREARRRVYRTLEGIKVSSAQYRTDIGSRVNGEMLKLKEWGWL
ncbi:MAG: hypothetical protein ACREBW_08595, partial [Candidatus Micrarchaeaceae archaeon]